MVKRAVMDCALACVCLVVGVVISSSTAQQHVKKVSPRFKDYSHCAMDTLKGLTNDRDFWWRLLTPMLRERVSGTQANLEVQEHIIKILTDPTLETKWTIEKDEFVERTPVDLTRFTNIVATQTPKASKVLILACHFDSKLYNNMEFIAATDSAVPCAMMLDIAVRLDSRLHQKKNADVSLQLLFLDGEEAVRQWTATDSLYGSRHLANKWNVPDQNGKRILDDIEAFILLDLIGGDNMKFWNFFPDRTTKLFEKLRKTEKLMRDKNIIEKNIPEMFSNEQALGSIQDDHVPFMQKGVPILHLISYPFPDQWHKRTDDRNHLNDKKTLYFLHILRVFVSSYLKLPVMCR